MSIHALLLHKIIRDQDVESFRKIKREWFFGDEAKLYNKIYKYFTAYGELPNELVLESEYVFTEEDFRTKTEYLIQKVKEKYSEYIKTRYQRILNTLDNEADKDTLLQKLALELYQFWHEDSSNVMTYDTYIEHLISKMEKYNSKGGLGIKTGYPSFDKTTGGLMPCEIYLVLGRIKQGKSQLLISITKNILCQGKKVVFISMEMPQHQIFDRLVGIILGINPKPYRIGQISPFAIEKLKGIDLSNLKVVEGQFKSTISEITTLVMIEKPEVLVIDGAYLIRLGSKYEQYLSKTEVLEEIMKGLKYIAHSLGIPVLASFQFKRETSRTGVMKQGVEAIDRIQWSDAIGQIMTSGLAVYDSEDNPKIKRIEILRGRHGEDGEFMINWDFDTGNFSEIVTEVREEEDFFAEVFMGINDEQE